MAVDAIVLSAGRASRFGVPKFLLPAGEGHVLLTRVLEQVLRVADGRVVVVLGRAAGAARYALARWVETLAEGEGSRICAVLNRSYGYGQSTSLRAGIRALPGTAGALVFLADMPVMGLARLERMRKAIRQARPNGGSSTRALAVAACTQGQMHPPVYLPAQLFPEIERLKGDQGARAVLSAHLGRVARVEWGLQLCDVDDWPTYRHLAYQEGWASEPFVPIPRVQVASKEVGALVDAALNHKVVPWLASGLLLLPARGETRWLDLTPPYRGVRGIVVGRSSTPAAYLQLLRRATLSALAAL